MKQAKMGNLHKKCEILFIKLTRWVYDRKYLTLIIICAISALLAAQTRDLTIDTRDESFFHRDDPTLRGYNQFRDTFGQDDTFIIGMKPKDGISIDFLNTLYDLHRDLESAVPYLDEVTSIVNARVVKAQGDTLNVDDLMKAPPKTEAELRQLFHTIDRYPLYEKVLVSEDRSMLFLLIRAQVSLTSPESDLMAGFAKSTPGNKPEADYLSNDQNMEINDAIHQVVDRYRTPKLTFYFAGSSAYIAELQSGILKDLGIMIPLSFIIICFFLLLLFRNLSGLIYPITTVALSLLSSLGIMAMVNIPITNAIQILPTFLIVVGIGDSVHILTIFYRNYRASGNKREAIIDAVGFAGLPVLMTSITTASGLLSFAWADVAVVAQLGYVAPIGVMLAFLYTVLLLPVLIGIFPVKQPKKVKSGSNPIIDRCFDAIARITTGRPILVASISGCIMLVAGYSALSVKFSHNSLKWLPPDTELRTSTEYLDKINGGTTNLEVIIDSGAPNGMQNPDLMRRIDAVTQEIPSINVNGISAGKAVSLADVLKETHRALNEDRDDAYTLPKTRQLMAQELLLFESSGSDDLEEITTGDYQLSRLSIMAPFVDSILYKDYIDAVRIFLKQRLPDQDIILTGHMVIFAQIIKHFISSMAKSYIIALVVITLLMVLMIGRIGIGLMSMIANIAPVLCVFGIMGLAGIHLDMATIFIGSIVIGLVVDDTIHYLHHFRKAYDQSSDIETAVRETLYTTGRALVITSLVLSGGFFIYTGSFLLSNIRFGWLSGCSVLIALAADFLLIPSLLTIVMGKRVKVSQTSAVQLVQ